MAICSELEVWPADAEVCLELVVNWPEIIVVLEVWPCSVDALLSVVAPLNVVCPLVVSPAIVVVAVGTCPKVVV